MVWRLAGRRVPVEGYGALAVEVSRDVVLVQVGEDGTQCLPSLQHVGRLRSFAAHVDGKAGVRREQGHLALGITPVGAVGVGVEQFAKGEMVGSMATEMEL